jgi:hypothetical protein
MTTNDRSVLTVLAAMTALFLSIALLPSPTAGQVPQGDPDVGAVDDIAVFNGGQTIVIGTKVQYRDSAGQVLGEIDFVDGLAFVLQPTDDRTYVMARAGHMYIIDSSDKTAPDLIGTREITDGLFRATEFVQFGANKLIVPAEKILDKAIKAVFTIDVSNESNIQVDKSEPDVEKVASGGGKLFGLRNGSLSELTPDGGGGYTKGPAVDTNGDKELAVNGAGNKVVTGGGSDGAIKAYDGTVSPPTNIASLLISGKVLAIWPLTNNLWIVVIDEFGSPKTVVYELKPSPPPFSNGSNGGQSGEAVRSHEFVERTSRYTRWLGPEPQIATDPSDSTLIGLARGDGGELLRADEPTMTSLATVQGLIYVHEITAASLPGGRYLYVSGDVSGMWIWDVSDPSSPVFLDSFTFGFDPFYCWLVYTPPSSQLALAAAAGPYAISGVGSGLNMYDLVDPASPSFVDRLFMSGPVTDVAVADSTAYAVVDAMGLRIANLSNPTDMTHITTVTTPSAATKVALAAGHAYVGTVSDGVRIVDVSVPASAAEVGAIPGLASIASVTSDGTSLYVGADSTMRIYSLASPTAPALVGTHGFGSLATLADIGIVDVPQGASRSSRSSATRLAYVAAGAEGFRIIDISNPAAPVEAANAPTAGDATSVAIDGNDVFLGSAGSGYMIFEVNPTTVPVLFQRFQAMANGRHVDLVWDFVADESLRGIEVLRATDAGSSPVKIHAEPFLPASLRSYRDETVEAGRSYEYTLLVRTTWGDLFQSPVERVTVPMREAKLFPNYPNPFNPSTTIAFDMPRAAEATLTVFDVAGRRVVTVFAGRAHAGMNTLKWDGRDAQGHRVSSGVYVARLETERTSHAIRLVLLK